MPEESRQQPTSIVDADFSALRASVAELSGRFGEFRASTLQRFDTLERRFDALERRFDTLDNKFNWLIGLIFASWMTIVGAIVGLYLKQ